MADHTTVSIPKVLVQKINKAVDTGFFNNIPDFVRQSIRHELERTATKLQQYDKEVK